MYNFLLLWGPYLWMAASCIAVAETLIIYSQSHKTYHLSNAITWACAGIYGMTLAAINIEWVAYINVSCFWVGGMTNVFAHSSKLRELFKIFPIKKHL